jgi:hypothetical protein
MSYPARPYLGEGGDRTHAAIMSAITPDVPVVPAHTHAPEDVPHEHALHPHTHSHYDGLPVPADYFPTGHTGETGPTGSPEET